MTVVGIDDTDSRERGMCTTFVASEVATALEENHHVEQLRLVRLNPAVRYKTRGNAAVAIHTDCPPERAFEIAREVVTARAKIDDERTSPGLVVAAHESAADVPTPVSEFTMSAIRDHLQIDDATQLIRKFGYCSWGDAGGRGRIGALAAIGSQAALSEWTYESIAYRESPRWGTQRDVDPDSIFVAADTGYPTVWDTVDREAGELVCVPHTPGPILHGIRGDDPVAVREISDRIESEPVHSRRTFITNQGTDVHLRSGTIETARDGGAYRLDGTVATEPETRRGGHVFFWLESGSDRIECVAFEPTKRFRTHVRNLRIGDSVTVCGEVSRGTVKLEKVAVRALTRTKRVSPTCQDCGNRMKSAGHNQGYRCRPCGTKAEGKAIVPVDRTLERGWYEVPPRARRHISKPLVRGGFDAPTHPER